MCFTMIACFAGAVTGGLACFYCLKKHDGDDDDEADKEKKVGDDVEKAIELMDVSKNDDNNDENDAKQTNAADVAEELNEIENKSDK